MQLLPDDVPYHVHLGDCIPHMLAEMPPNSVDFAVFSPPFPSLYAYTSEAGDIGNSEDMRGDAKIHLSYFFRALFRVVKAGRVALVHCTDLPLMKRSGDEGLYPFAALLARLAKRAGWIYSYTWAIRKNPQAQAIRGKAWELKFEGVETDRAMSRGCLPDYLVKLRKPGVNAVPIVGCEQVSRNDWIDWAEYCWTGIRETDTLQYLPGKGRKGSKSEGDTRHICPLQLGTIERAVRLYSNPGELVFSPFAGIGSEGYVALGGESRATKRMILQPRRFYGIELKPEYHALCLENCAKAVKHHAEASKTLFDGLAEAEADKEGGHNEEVGDGPSA